MARLRSYLPEDTVFDILSRLPVDSLLRFRTVCKSWLSIISDSQFVQSHHRITGQKKTWILATETLLVTPRYFQYIFMPKHFYGCELISSCNGIVCVANYSGDRIYLWNPSVKKYKRLPSPKRYSRVYGRTIGFGYDSISNDHKVLCFENESDDSENLVQLFSTNCGFWSKICVHTKLPRRKYSISVPVINGVLYFEAEDKGNDDNVLISFDLHNEVFGVVRLPSCIQKQSDILNFEDLWTKERRMSNILDFQGSLAIIIVDSTDIELVHEDIISLEYDGSPRQGISVWTLEDNSEMSWIKKISICADELSWMKRFGSVRDLWIDFYLGNGQFYGRNKYFEDYSPACHISHVWFNYKKKEGNGFQFQEDEDPTFLMKYTESLVSFKGFKSTARKQSRHSRKKRRLTRY